MKFTVRIKLLVTLFITLLIILLTSLPVTFNSSAFGMQPPLPMPAMPLKVYATDGDETLGGSDLDLCLYDIIKHKVRREK